MACLASTMGEHEVNLRLAITVKYDQATLS